MTGVFDFALQSQSDLEKEYKARDYVFYEIVFLKQLEACISMHEEIKDLQIDEFRISFIIINANKEEYRAAMQGRAQILTIRPGIYFDIKSSKHSVDYFSSNEENVDYIYNLDYQGQVDYGARVRETTEQPIFLAIQKLNKVMQNLCDCDNDVRYLIESNLGTSLKPDLGDIILKMCGEKKFNIWKSAVEKKQLQHSIEAKLGAHKESSNKI